MADARVQNEVGLALAKHMFICLQYEHIYTFVVTPESR